MSICGAILANSNLAASCGPVGGIGKTVYVFNWQDIAFSTNATGSVTGISFTNSCAKGYQVVTRHDANQTTDDMALVNGAPIINQSVVLRGAVSGPDPRLALNNLAQAERLVLVVQENGNANDRYKVYGFENGLRATAFSLASNQNAADLAGFEMTLTGVDQETARYLLPTSQTTPALQLAYLQGLTINRAPRAITAILPNASGTFTYEGGGPNNVINIVGCGLSGSGNVNIGGRTTNPATGGTYTSIVTVVNDNLITVTLPNGGGGSSTSSTSVVITHPAGNITFTAPNSITIIGDAA